MEKEIVQWEYEIHEKSLNIGSFDEQRYLDLMGESGWELCSVVDSPGHGLPVTYYWKKQR